MKTTTEIVFVESTHQYFVKGREVRSLSSLTRPLHEPLPDHPVVQRNLANARARGAQVDDGAARIMLGKGFPIATVSDEAIPYLHAFASFWQETKPTMEGQALYVQTPLYCEELDFCCTPDFHLASVVWDLKATSKASRLWGLQTAGQALANSCLERRILWLRPTTRHQYELHDARNGNRRIFSDRDFHVIRALARGELGGSVVERWKEAA